MRRGRLVVAVAIAALAAPGAIADSPPAFAPGSSADGYPPTTHFETSCVNKCDIGRGGNAITHVVFLSSEGGKDATIATEQNDAGKSIHYLVANDGSVSDFVPEADTAWYAGDYQYNRTSIGVIVEGFVSDPSSFGDLDYQRAAQLVAAITHRYGLPIDDAHVLGRGSIPGTTYTGTGPDPAFDLVRLRTLAQAYRDELDPPPPQPGTTTNTTGTPPPPPAPDTTPPVVTASASRSQPVGPALAITVRCPSEHCTAAAGGTLRLPGARGHARTVSLPKGTVSLAQGSATAIHVKLGARLRAAIRRALRAHRKVTATLRLTVTDDAGNVTKLTRQVRLTR